MNKAKVVTAAATVAASFGVVTQVHADDTDLATVSNNTEVAQNQATENVTKSDVDEAKANLDTANQAVSNQEQVVSDATQSADKAQTAYDKAQQETSEAQKLVDQATPENIATAQNDVTEAEKEVAQAQGAEKVAEDVVNKAQEAVSNQSSVVSQAQQSVNDAQAAVDAAQKDVNDKQAILDGTGQAEIIANHDKAQKDVNSAQSQVEKAGSDLTKAQEADANRQEAIDNAQKTVDEANQTVTSTKSDLDVKTAKATDTQATEDTKKAAVDAAQKDVNDKQAILDGTGQKAILDEAEAAKVDEADKKATLADAQSDLTKAQEADANRQEAIDNAQKTVDGANQTVTSTKSDLEAKTTTAQETEQALENAQSAYNTAENDYKAINTITMSDEYAKALKDAFDLNLSDSERAAAEEVLKRLATSEGLKNSFKHNENDKAKAVDINNITAEQAQELSLFAADLINQAREIVGTLPVSVSADSANAAKEHGYYYSKNISSAWSFNHDTSDLDQQYNWVDEDWASGVLANYTRSTRSKSYTMDTLKESIYSSINRWLFNSSEWLHASSVAGTRNATTGDSFVGIGFSIYADGTSGVNLNIFNTNYSDLSTFDKTALENQKSADKVTSTYNTAQAELAQATASNTAAQEAKATAQTAYDNAASQLATASTALTQAQSVAVQTPAAQAKLATA